MTKKRILVIFLSAVLIIYTAFPVGAYQFSGDGYWIVDGANVTYQYNDDLPETYKDPIYWGAWMWSQNCDYKPTLKTYGMINTMAYDYGAVRWNGLTYVNGQSSVPIDSYYTNAVIHFNRYTMDAMSDVEKKIIACHEFGHAGGLFHVGDVTCMMYESSLVAYSYNPNLRYAPAQDDINGMNARY